MYRFEPVQPWEPDEHEACARLLRDVFRGTRKYTPDFIAWQYRDNPVGQVVGFNAFALAGELVAHYAAIPVRALLGGRTQVGLLSLNTATRPNHAGKGLFTELARRTYDAARTAGYAFVVGVANANSTPGFVGKLGFRLVSPLHALLGLGPLPRRASRADPRLDFEPVWDGELLAWRLRNPSSLYRTARIPRDRVYVVAPTGYRGIDIILWEGARTQAAIAGLRRRRGPRLRLWIGIDPLIELNSIRFRALPDRLRPSPLNLIFKDLTDARSALSPEGIRFAAIDFDAY